MMAILTTIYFLVLHRLMCGCPARWWKAYSVRTHRDVIELAQHIKSGLTRDAIKNVMGSKLSTPKPTNEDEVLDGSLDLVARLLLMIKFGSQNMALLAEDTLFGMRNYWRNL